MDSNVYKYRKKFCSLTSVFVNRLTTNAGRFRSNYRLYRAIPQRFCYSDLLPVLSRDLARVILHIVICHIYLVQVLCSEI